MKSLLKRWWRPIGVAAVCAGLFVAPGLDQSAIAQGPNDPPGAVDPNAPVSGQGRYLDGYLGTIVLMLLVFFIVGKSARR